MCQPAYAAITKNIIILYKPLILLNTDVLYTSLQTNHQSV